MEEPEIERALQREGSSELLIETRNLATIKQNKQDKGRERERGALMTTTATKIS